MNENINLCEILKDTPKGTLLYSPLIGEVKFDEINNLSNFPVQVIDKKGGKFEFTQQGTFFLSKGECLLFPSKDQRDWSKYQKPFKDGDKTRFWNFQDAKDGDVITYANGWTCIFKCIHGTWYSSYCFITDDGKFHMGYERHDVDTTINGDVHLATEEQRNLLFQKIKEAGYKWNAETKTLEKLIVPKFKVGDRIKHKDDKTVNTITGRKDDYYFIKFYNIKKNDYQNEKVSLKDQDNYELVPNKFDISTLKPFDKVLVRNGGQDKWQAGLFSYLEEKKIGIDYGSYTKYLKSVTTYNVNSHLYNYCIPYNYDTNHLVGTTEEAPEFYQIEYETSLID